MEIFLPMMERYKHQYLCMYRMKIKKSVVVIFWGVGLLSWIKKFVVFAVKQVYKMKLYIGDTT